MTIADNFFPTFPSHSYSSSSVSASASAPAPASASASASASDFFLTFWSSLWATGG